MALTAEQVALRATGLGASDIAAAVGLSPHTSPLELYREKVGERQREETWGMVLGSALEPAILALWGRQQKAPVLDSPGTLVHPTEAWVLATPDALSTLPSGKRVCVEAKRADYKRPDWGRAGTDEVPVSYACQCLWLMLVLRARGEPIDEVQVAALFRGSQFEVFNVPWDAERAAWLLEKGREFWFRHVVARVPPQAREAA